VALEVENRIRSALQQRGVTATAQCPQHVTITSSSAAFAMRALG
jgi:hypothetical protein